MGPRLLDLKVSLRSLGARSYIYVIRNYAGFLDMAIFYGSTTTFFLPRKWMAELDWFGLPFVFGHLQLNNWLGPQVNTLLNVSYLLIVFVIILNICVIFFSIHLLLPATCCCIAYLSREGFDVFFSCQKSSVFVNKALYWRLKGLEGIVKVDWFLVNAWKAFLRG